jgi:ribosomal protein S18 acetylase RimI-like enzyme
MKKETPTVTIDKCSVQELSQLRDLAIRTFKVTYAAQNTAEVMADYLQRAFNEQQLRQELTHPESEFYILKSDADWIGYIKLNEGSAQTEDRTDNALEIERIYVDATFHGRGLGKMLIRKALEVARDKSKECVWLGVWEHNPKAIQFYERQGFKKNGTHTFYIGGEAQVDWVMEKEV